MGDHAPLEHVTVAGQQDAVLARRDLRHLGVLVVVAVERVEAAQAQVARQRAQLGVEHEADAAQGRSADLEHGRDIERLEHRVDRDALAVAHDVVEAHRLAVDEDQLDLGVRHAQRLDHVLDRRAPVELVRELDLAPLGRQEIVELLVEAEPRPGHCHLRPGKRALPSAKTSRECVSMR